MALPNDSITVTPGTGATIATHLAGGKEYQVVVLAGESGHIIGSKDTYVFPIPSQVHVAAANTIHWDIYNTTTSLVRVISIRQIPNITTAVTGVVFDWQLIRTSAVGTGGTTISSWLPDSTQTAQPAGLTVRSKPTGGATTIGSSIFNYALSSEETNTGTIMIASQGGLELVPGILASPYLLPHGILLRQNEGLKCVQVTNSAAGNTGWIITATVE
jgi:hypothetical protein